jgi:hypothetical protein
MTIDDPRLPLLGDALREAAAVDLALNEKTQAGPARSDEARSRRRIRPRFRIGTRTAVTDLHHRPARGWNTNARSTPTT